MRAHTVPCYGSAMQRSVQSYGSVRPVAAVVVPGSRLRRAARGGACHDALGRAGDQAG